jgi:hypothetical protein
VSHSPSPGALAHSRVYRTNLPQVIASRAGMCRRMSSCLGHCISARGVPSPSLNRGRGLPECSRRCRRPRSVPTTT